jgi:chromosome partitioning protein
MGKVLAVVSQKGGVGKTTTAVNIAAALGQRGIKTLLVDADPQGSVRYGLGLHAPEDRVGLSDFLAGTHSMQDVVRPTVLPWLRVVAAGSVSDAGRHEDYADHLAHSAKLQELLARARERGYLVVVDTPPGLGPVVHTVLQAAQSAIIPLQCEPLALQTTSQMLRGLRAAISTNADLELEGILLTMVEADSPVSQRVANYVREHLPAGLVLDIVIPRSHPAAEAFGASQPLVLRSPDDPAAKAYIELGERLARRLQ